MAPRKRPLHETDTNSYVTKPKSKKIKGSEANPPLPNYDALSMPELKAELKSRELHISGSRPTLVMRLRQSDHDRSLPVKQAIEAAARKRRKGKKPPRISSEDDYEREYKVLRGGPNGRPVYDVYGYKLDYAKVSRAMRAPARSRPSLAKIEAWMEKDRREMEIKASIMGIKNESDGDTWIWDDRVAQDLQIPHHKVEICDYEEWQRQGFTFDPEAVTMEDEERVSEMMIGSGLRA